MEDKKALFKKIIQGKEKVSSFRDLLQIKEDRKLKDESAKKAALAKKAEIASKINISKTKPSSVGAKTSWFKMTD